MKKAIILLSALSVAVMAFAQEMRVKKHNLTYFVKDKKFVPEVLKKESSANAQQHPEFGTLPFNASCDDCVELIDKRTQSSRTFLNAKQPNHSYTQTSYLPLHYQKFEGDIWHTIDPRLQADPGHPNVYVAENQPAPTKYDFNTHTSSIKVFDTEFKFNQNLSMYYYEENAYSKTENAHYGTVTVGSEGVSAKDIWPGMDMEQIFSAGEIKTNFVISAPLQIPVSDNGWMVIQDKFSIPAGFTFEEAPDGEHLPDGKYRGNYLLKDDKGEVLFTYEKPSYVDALAYGVLGSYQLLKNGNDYTLRMFIPVNWLTRSANVFPIVIDPIVTGRTKLGDFRLTVGGLSANMGFTTKPLSCDYHMIVQFPGANALKKAWVDVEYQLTYDNQCGTPPLPALFCTFSQVTMEIVNDTCGTTTGLLACNPAQPPYTGTCTTDSNLVPGANAILINNFVPNYLSCYAPQCATWHIPFTLKNRDSICGDVCGYLCARGNMWQMTIEACTVEGNITQDKTVVCPGDPITFTAHPDCGVPPYHYVWLSQGGNQIDTIYGTPNFVISPQVDGDVTCVIVDTCGVEAFTNLLSYTIQPAPPADAGPDARLCEGGQVFLGGNPTSTGGVNTIWSGETPAQTAWLSSTTDPNPVANIPAGTIDTFYYVVTCSSPGFSCSRSDTMRVYSQANPVAVIDSTGPMAICENQLTGATVIGNFANYQWNTGAATQSITISQAGQYFAVVTDAQGCKDTSNTLTVVSIAPPSVTVHPDTLIMFGDSVTLYTDLNLSSVSIDSFMWYPLVNISCTNCPNPVVSPVNDQYYGISVYANGCSNTDSALIRVILPNNFYIPNVFTPNGDGNNDIFYILSQSGVRVLSFQVFDRIGEKVHDGTYPWDGNYKGKPATPGVYVYVCKLGLFGDDRAVFRKGSVTLIR